MPGHGRFCHRDATATPAEDRRKHECDVGAADLAMDALVIEGDFEGREEWYSPLEDKPCSRSRTTAYGADHAHECVSQKQFLEKMTELTESSNLSVRTAPPGIDAITRKESPMR